MKIIVSNGQEAIDVSRRIQEIANALKMSRLDSLDILSKEGFLCRLRDAVVIEGDGQ